MTRITEMTGVITLGRLGMSVAYAASISHRIIARKLEQEQKAKWKKGKGEEESFVTNPTSQFI